MNSSSGTIKSSFLTHKEQRALKEYQEYKKLRTVVIKPIRAFNDTEAILKDLQGEGFLSLEKEIERSKKSRAKASSHPKLKQSH